MDGRAPDRCRQIQLPLSWHWIERVRATVAELLGSVREDIRDAAMIVASELAENVMKYGEPAEGEDHGEVTIEIVAGVVRIRSMSGASPERARRVLERVERIASADAIGLYADRLRFLMENPTNPASELGLLRILFEGQFSLQARYDAPTLVITAERRLE